MIHALEPSPSTPLASPRPGPSVRVRALVRGACPAPGAEVWRLDDVRLDLGAVLGQGLAPVSLAADAWVVHPGRRRPHLGHLRMRGHHDPVAFTVRAPAGGGSAEPGTFLVADDARALLAALGALEDVHDEGLRELAALARRSPIEASAAATRLLATGGLDPDDGVPPGLRPAGSVLRRVVFEARFPVLLAAGDPAERGGLAVRGESTARAEAAFEVVAEVSQRVRGHLVPRRARLSWLDRNRRTLLVDDGREARVQVRGLAGLRPETLALFDGGALEEVGPGDEGPGDEGRAGPGAAADPFEAHLAARCLVRVPPRAELEGLLAGAKRLRRPGAEALHRPAFVRDSRSSVRLTGRERVLATPGAAAWVLGHTHEGLFVPDAGGPRPLSGPDLPERGAWLVLCDAGPA